MRKPLLITFEGPDKVGKTTQIHRFCEALTAHGMEYILTREPGGAPVAEKIRDLLLDKENAMSAECEMLLYAAARAEHVRQTIRPALQHGKHVVCDRFLESSIAYQAYGRELGEKAVRAANALALDGLQPDLTFLLMLDASVTKTRRNAQEQDRLEREAEPFFARVEQGYRALCQSGGAHIVEIDANGTVDEVAERIWKAFERRAEI